MASEKGRLFRDRVEIAAYVSLNTNFVLVRDRARNIKNTAVSISVGTRAANGIVCKTIVHGFESHPIGQFLSCVLLTD